jgi:hypothetical protein
MGDMADHISYNDYDYGPERLESEGYEPESYEPGIEPGAGTYTIKKKTKSDPDFYHIEFRKLFKIIEVEHETEKAFLFYSDKGSFWCAKKLVRIKDIKDILSWKIWNQFEYKFKSNDICEKVG